MAEGAMYAETILGEENEIEEWYLKSVGYAGKERASSADRARCADLNAPRAVSTKRGVGLWRGVLIRKAKLKKRKV